MELRSARVTIRPWQRHDDDLADEWPSYNDPFESIWNLPRNYSWNGDGWYNGFDTGSMRRSWAVEDRRGRLIGRISLREIDERKSQARLGITIGAPFVSMGFGTDALMLFLDYYFTRLGFEAMVLDVAAPNIRAVRCYDRLGFSRVGSDWRSAGVVFDRNVLAQSCYAGLRSFFREGARGLEVEFYEMQLRKAEWVARRQAARER